MGAERLKPFSPQPEIVLVKRLVAEAESSLQIAASGWKLAGCAIPVCAKGKFHQAKMLGDERGKADFCLPLTDAVAGARQARPHAVLLFAQAKDLMPPKPPAARRGAMLRL